jgi:hypothetical protein
VDVEEAKEADAMLSWLTSKEELRVNVLEWLGRRRRKLNFLGGGDDIIVDETDDEQREGESFKTMMKLMLFSN